MSWARAAPTTARIAKDFILAGWCGRRWKKMLSKALVG